ncbi:potassium channel family protein [Kribbella sp. VKM Ac-2568]|uniref:potassium channel family protein n=1 Tax=Kribbella sp. VKM Ac-2568 TaxID=2512219 RepID=UPI0010445632|nr:potassium channel family protein [Kribbella sp. VKM Ac-2568]TCM43658.1 ion channel [Kribbella sp. VKM Ac-2568]
MPDPAEVQTPMPAHRRRVLLIAVVRGLSIVTVLVVAYFTLPLDELAKVPFGVIVAGGVVIVAAVTMLQVRSIIRAAQPAAKAIEALAVTVPLFLLLFASTYYMMSQANPGNFNLTGLTRGDSLYFTVTVFTTVGFGDILATSHSARTIVTAQMILDLVLIGAVIRALVQAAKVAPKRSGTPTADA